MAETALDLFMQRELSMGMLRSVEELVDALGGSAAAAELAGVGASAVSNWKTNGVIPAEYFLIFSAECARREIRFDRRVFGFKREVA
jgi:hypothetical protein